MTAESKTPPRILLAVTGCAQAEVTPRLVANLLYHPEMGRHEVIVVATPSALQFFEKAEVEKKTGRRVFVQHSDGTEEFPVPHINLAEWADVMLVYPASANTLAKCAHGICDTLVTNLVMTVQCSVFFGPTMNKIMSESPVVQKNIQLLEGYDHQFIPQEMARVVIKATGQVEEKMYCTERMVLAVVDAFFHDDRGAGRGAGSSTPAMGD